MIEVIDSRLFERFDELNEPDRIFLNYYQQNGNWLLHITSGMGTGHPLYLLVESETEFEVVQQLSRISYDEYGEMPIFAGDIYKENLYDTYQANQGKYDQAISNFSTTNSSDLVGTYDSYCKLIGITNLMNTKEASDSNGTTQPTAEEIFGYYRDYIIDDLPDFSSDLKNHVQMKGIDEQGLAIIKHVIHGSEINITIDGSVIIYSIYAIGGLDADGNVAKSHVNDAYYDTATGNHGLY